MPHPLAPHIRSRCPVVVGVNTTSRRIILWILNATAGIVGIWALVLPREFYESFPGLGFAAWASEGPFNEHFVRDVGAFYLALLGAGVVAALQRRADASVAVGVAWLVFSIPHLTYHLGHLDHLPLLDVIAQPIALAATLVLSIPLIVPPRSAIATATPTTTTTEQEYTR